MSYEQGSLSLFSGDDDVGEGAPGAFFTGGVFPTHGEPEFEAALIGAELFFEGRAGVDFGVGEVAGVTGRRVAHIVSNFRSVCQTGFAAGSAFFVVEVQFHKTGLEGAALLAYRMRGGSGDVGVRGLGNGQAEGGAVVVSRGVVGGDVLADEGANVGFVVVAGVFFLFNRQRGAGAGLAGEQKGVGPVALQVLQGGELFGGDAEARGPARGSGGDLEAEIGLPCVEVFVGGGDVSGVAHDVWAFGPGGRFQWISVFSGRQT